MNGERAIRGVAIVGGGIVGLSAALAFARALPEARVTVVETAADPAALADILPVLQGAGPALHALIGLDENELVRAGIASHYLGTLFEDWSAGGEPWWHVLGPYGKPAGAIPFDQIWVRAHACGQALSYDRYAVGAALARAGKFVHPAADPNFVGSRFAYGLRLEPAPYRARLLELAGPAGIAVRRADLGSVERRDDGRIAALRLRDGDALEADLYVDCSGPSAMLAGVVDDSFEDWSDWLPCGEMTIATSAGPEVPPPSDRIRANAQGWAAQMPLRGRTVTARLSVRRGRGKEPGIALTRGRRLRPWVGNMLALGEAATALDPLHRPNLDMAHRAILLALELLPGRDFDRAETAEYNRRAEQVTRRARDFVALHYLGSGRSDGVWPAFAQVEPPDSLARTLDQYAHRGRLPFHEDESITRDGWTASLLGLGIVPRHVDPAAGGLALDEAVRAMARLAHEIDQVVMPLPSYGDYLSAIRAGASRSR